MKKKLRTRIGSIFLAVLMLLGLLPVSALAEENVVGSLEHEGGTSTTVTTIDFATFLQNVATANYNYDGQGVTVSWSPSSACTNNINHTCPIDNWEADGNNAQRIQAPSAQYQIFSDVGDISISNVNFQFIPSSFTLCMNSTWGGTGTEENIKNAEFQLKNTGSVSFTNCTFDQVIVSPYSSATTTKFTECDFADVYNAYTIKDVNAPELTVENCTFINCSGGIYLEHNVTRTKVVITGNTFTDMDQNAASGKENTRGLIQFSAGSGDYTNATITISNNSSTGSAYVLRQLNPTIGRDSIAGIIEAGDNNFTGAEVFTHDSSTANVVLPSDTISWNDNTVFDGTTYYPTMADALKNVHQTEAQTLWCKPGADVGTLTHGHVCYDLTVYGNGAYISGGEHDFELDTYDTGHTDDQYLTQDVDLKIYDLNGCAVWGQRNSAYTLNIYLENCKNMNRVYISGTSGINNITLKNCNFDGTQTANKKASSCTLYSNAPGGIKLENCTFTGVQEPINLNNKSEAGTAQTIEVINCTFTDCSTTDICTTDITYAAPIRIVSSAGATSMLTVDNCTFSYPGGGASVNGDILLGDGREGERSYPVSATIMNTAAKAQIQNPGDRTADTNNARTDTVAKSETAVTLSNVVAKIGEQCYTSLNDAIVAAGVMSGDITIELVGDADLSTAFAAARSNSISYDLSTSDLTGLTIRGGSQDAKIISGVDGNDIDGSTYCPKLNVALPSNAVFTVENLTFPNDLQFDSDDGAVVMQNCVFNGSISGYPQAKSISYLNNTFEFKGTATNFYTGNAYPVWYKSDGNLDFAFNNNTVIGCRGVHIETRSDAASGYKVDIEVNDNRFTLKDDQYPTKAIALQLVRNLNGNISFQNNYVDAYMAVCFFSGLNVQDGAALTAKNNYLVDDCKLYGASEWNAANEAAADAFAKSIVDGLTRAGSTVNPGHTEHNYVDGICTICSQREPTSSSSGDYLVSVDNGTNGKITVSSSRADKGDTVTITVKPNTGYELEELTVTDSKGNELKLTDKGNGKYTFTMPGSKVEITATFVEIGEEQTNPFIDMSTSDYYYNAVLWAVANGVTAGTSADTFSPNAAVSRAQMVTFLWRAHGSPTATGTNPFNDVSTSDYYYDAVLWAVANGVTTGTSATAFSPNADVTRSQAVTFQWRAAGSPAASDNRFVDVAADTWYYNAVSWAVANGVTSGTSSNNFSPDVVVSRAQAVTFLYRELG